MATAAKAKGRGVTIERTTVFLPGSVQGLLNRRQVCEALGGMSVRKLNSMIAAGTFPRPDVSLGGVKMGRWSVGLVNAWCLEAVRRGTVGEAS